MKSLPGLPHSLLELSFQQGSAVIYPLLPEGIRGSESLSGHESTATSQVRGQVALNSQLLLSRKSQPSRPRAEKVMVVINLCVNLTGQQGAQIFGQTSPLGVSTMCSWRSAWNGWTGWSRGPAQHGRPHPLTGGLSGTKRLRKGNLRSLCLTAGTGTSLFRLQTGTDTPVRLVLRPLDTNQNATPSSAGSAAWGQEVVDLSASMVTRAHSS